MVRCTPNFCGLDHFICMHSQPFICIALEISPLTIRAEYRPDCFRFPGSLVARHDIELWKVGRVTCLLKR